MGGRAQDGRAERAGLPAANLKVKTGRDWAEWVDVLDAAGAVRRLAPSTSERDDPPSPAP